MDPLSDVLSLLKPRSYRSGGFDVGGDLAIKFPKHEGIKCYAVVSGQCWLSVAGLPDTVRLMTGDCFLLPRGLPFSLATDLTLTPVDFLSSPNLEKLQKEMSGVRPDGLPDAEPMKLAAYLSHYALYALMIAMPLIGWAMLSAAEYPVVIWPGIWLPQIAPQSASLHTLLWNAHFYLAFLFFALILMHLAAGLFHALVRRDGVFDAMGPRLTRDKVAPAE